MPCQTLRKLLEVFAVGGDVSNSSNLLVYRRSWLVNRLPMVAEQ